MTGHAHGYILWHMSFLSHGHALAVYLYFYIERKGKEEGRGFGGNQHRFEGRRVHSTLSARTAHADA